VTGAGLGAAGFAGGALAAGAFPGAGGLAAGVVAAGGVAGGAAGGLAGAAAGSAAGAAAGVAFSSWAWSVSGMFQERVAIERISAARSLFRTGTEGGEEKWSTPCIRCSVRTNRSSRLRVSREGIGNYNGVSVEGNRESDRSPARE